MFVKFSGDTLFDGEEGKKLLSSILKETFDKTGFDSDDLPSPFPESISTFPHKYACTVEVPDGAEPTLAKAFAESLRNHVFAEGFQNPCHAPAYTVAFNEENGFATVQVGMPDSALLASMDEISVQ